MKRILIDCDPGHDDMMAIMLASASPEFELLGITTVAGNQTGEKTYEAAFCQSASDAENTDRAYGGRDREAQCNAFHKGVAIHGRRWRVEAA